MRTVLLLFALSSSAFGLGETRYAVETPGAGAFALAAAPIYVDSGDYPGVLRAARGLAADLERVTGRPSAVINEPAENAILAGTLGKSRVIDRLVKEGKLDSASLAGKWESFVIQVVPGYGLVIAGSDKRGTIYGLYDVSEQIGVSPWYWWADVPVRHKDALYVRPGRYAQDEPAVRYRGIFLNDEAPSLTGWVNEKYGTYNHQFYEKVFELLLRLKGNYLWPAMWNNAFNEDDPLNPKLADEYGIVMGTSHHEPMLRAQQEWKRHGKGPWDYARNAEVLRAFWDEGIRRNKDYESIVTIGMRGDGDMPMSESANIALLEGIVADQRKILAERVGPNVPQLWALYKEVQEYYEKGMRVPDDVTLLWCDDNWGNIRRLPTPEERKRSGGAGIYYHFDYVGGPRSYKWLNTVPIAKVWEQMNLAYQYGANRIWIVNVGDLKPMEFPIEFFLSLAWNPERWPKEKLGEFTRLWAEREFGPAHAGEIADIVAKYTKYNGWRKPELLEPSTFSLLDYQEADTVLAEWQAIVAQAERIDADLPHDARDAFYQLVLYPVKASATVAEIYITAGRNQLHAGQGRASANELAARVRRLFETDAGLSDYYNHKLAGGKWNHMMDQTHLGYTFWNQPPLEAAPPLIEVRTRQEAEMGVAVEGSRWAWPSAWGEAAFPQFDRFNGPRHYLDVFNRGRTPFEFTASASDPWIQLSATGGTVGPDLRIRVTIDWSKAPQPTAEGSVTITRPRAQQETVKVRASSETIGYVSIEAEHYTKNIAAPAARWEKIPDHGRTLSSMTVFPVTAASVTPPRDSPCLEYEIDVFHPGQAQVEAILAPSLNFVPGRGLRYAVSFDDEPPQVVDALGQNSLRDWERSVEDGVRKARSTHRLATAGRHTLKLWMVDPGVVLEKLVVDLGGLKPSYLGPSETNRSLTVAAQ